MVLGLGMPNRKVGSTTCFVCLNPVPPYDLDSRKAGFQSQQGAKTMKPTTGNHAHITPTLGKSTTNLDRYLSVHKGIADCQWMLIHDNPQRALGSLTSATRHLKQIVSILGGLNHGR